MGRSNPLPPPGRPRARREAATIGYMAPPSAPPPPPHEVTQLLGRLAAGERDVQGALVELLGAELRRLARSQLAGRAAGHTLQPTALLHEAWMRIARADGYDNREHFLAVAARAMRCVLVDYERRRRAAKRPDLARRSELDLDGLTCPAPPEFASVDLLDLEAALEALEEVDEGLVRTVELLFHSGLAAHEAAAVLGVSTRTVERQWRAARAFLRSYLDNGALDG